jgi:hypothetical protein
VNCSQEQNMFWRHVYSRNASIVWENNRQILPNHIFLFITTCANFERDLPLHTNPALVNPGVRLRNCFKLPLLSSLRYGEQTEKLRRLWTNYYGEISIACTGQILAYGLSAMLVLQCASWGGWHIVLFKRRNDSLPKRLFEVRDSVETNWITSFSICGQCR